MDRILRRLLTTAALLAVATAAPACARAPAADAAPTLNRRAALARIVVDNRTDRTLVIRFRYALSPSGSVEVGRVPPRSTRELAPVPALEPIILEAEGEGLHRVLEPRTLEMDDVWTWTIAPDTGHER